MSDRRTGPDRCSLCGTPISGGGTEGDASGPFCSSGCRDVHDELGGREGADSGDVHPGDGRGRNESDDEIGDDGGAGSEHDEGEDGDGESETEGDDEEGAPVRTFLRIDGMYSPTCEAFLESVAEKRPGVERAEASYVTETVRVDHDPGRISPEDLRDALSTTGYTAYLREEAGSDDGAAGGVRRSREIDGIRKRRSDDMLELRYVVGVVFGTFVLLPYVAVLYPVYLASFTDWGMLHLYEDAFQGFDGLQFMYVYFVLTGIVLYFTGMPLLRGTYVSLKTRRPTTDLLAAVTVVSAYAYGTVAVVADRNEIYYDLTILVAALVTAAIFYEATVKRRALDRLTDLTISQVDEARRYGPDGTAREVPVEELEAGDRVLVREGERIPVDGVLAEGECRVDEAVVTGESRPVAKRAGDEVVGGSVVTDDAAVVTVGDRTTSSIDRLTRDVWNLQSATHGVHRRADRHVSSVLAALAVVAVVAGTTTAALGGSLPAVALAVLLTGIVASPWALAFAARLSIAESIAEAMERGIVVFDESVFERLRDVDVVVFDKTGTLTTGEMTVLEADAPETVLRVAAAVEQRASHPAGKAIAAAFGGDESDQSRTDGGRADPAGDRPQVREFRTHSRGVGGVVDGREVLVGHPDLFTDRGWTLTADQRARIESARDDGRLPVVVGRDGAAEGIVVVGDEPRAGWDDAVAGLEDAGIEVVVLTGDDATATGFLERHPAVDRVFAGVPPAGKTAAIRRLCADDRVAMVGDGTNDAPALAEADLGISLGSGTALASDAADLAIVDDELGAVERAFALADGARRRLVRNLGLALVYNALVVPVAVVGLLNPLFTTVAVVACSVLVGASASRDLL